MSENRKKRKKQRYLEYKPSSLEDLFIPYCELLNLIDKKGDVFLKELNILRELILNKEPLERLLYFLNLENIYLIDKEKWKKFRTESSKRIYLDSVRKLEIFYDFTFKKSKFF